MKHISFLSTLILLAASAIAQITGSWQGTLQVPGAQLPLIIHIEEKEGAVAVKLDSPNQNTFGLAATTASYTGGEFSFSITALMLNYEGTLSEDAATINGTFKQGTFSTPLNFSRITEENAAAAAPRRPQEPKPPFPYQIEEVTFTDTTDQVRLAGTLTLPKDVTHPPVVVLISGSGPQDRNEEIFNHKPFWVIADYLSRNGIGVLRYDDRGVGQSETGEHPEQVTSAHLANDALAAYTFLKQRGHQQVGLVGHSEGGMIAPMIAAEHPDVSFIVLLAGPGITGDSLLALQTYLMGKAEGLPEETARWNQQFFGDFLQYVKNYKGSNPDEDFSQKLDELLSGAPGQQLGEAEKQSIRQTTLAMVQNEWMRYFIAFDPAPYLSKVNCPVLAINGTLDMQVPYRENLAGIEAALKQAGNKHYKIVPAEGLNHLFQHATTGGGSEYGTIEETFAPEIMSLMQQWIKEQVK